MVTGLALYTGNKGISATALKAYLFNEMNMLIFSENKPIIDRHGNSRDFAGLHLEGGVVTS